METDVTIPSTKGCVSYCESNVSQKQYIQFRKLCPGFDYNSVQDERVPLPDSLSET